MVYCHRAMVLSRLHQQENLSKDPHPLFHPFPLVACTPGMFSCHWLTKGLHTSYDRLHRKPKHAIKTLKNRNAQVVANLLQACWLAVIKPTPGCVPIACSGILRNPDRTRTRTWTRTRRKPGLGKNPDSCSDSRLRNPDSTIENPDSKSKIYTGFDETGFW